MNEKFIFIADTCENSIAMVDRKNNKKINYLYPFTDNLNNPIYKDHNHINSIYFLPDCILFVAHNGGNNASLIGLLHEDVCHIFKYPSVGCHDLIPLTTGLVFSDSFGGGAAQVTKKPGIFLILNTYHLILNLSEAFFWEKIKT